MATPRDTVILPGARWRITHQASVSAILGKDTRPVSSRGSRFYNADRWTARVFTRLMCKWARENPGATPTRKDIANWVAAANKTKVTPEIVLATTPDQLPLPLAMALTGGAYHEAWHTKWSCRRDLEVPEMANLVLPQWGSVSSWGALEHALQTWWNILEDIRIERRGREEYPGTEDKMHDLQDFILDQERAGKDTARAHGEKTTSALTTIVATFRDLGLGYVTATQEAALAKYRKEDPLAFAFVHDGPLRPYLDQAVALSTTDDLGSFRLSLGIVKILLDAATPAPQEEEPTPSDKGGETKPSLPMPGDLDLTLEQLGLCDNNSAFTLAIQGHWEHSSKGGHPWHPYNPGQDRVEVAPLTGTAEVDKLLAEVQASCSFLRARLMHLAHALEMTDTLHGLRKGNSLSPRFLVQSALEIRAGQMPTQAWMDTSLRMDLSMAVATVIDQSASMSTKRTNALKMMLMLAEPLSKLNVPVQASGFRMNGTLSVPSATDTTSYHRLEGVTHDVFQCFGDRFTPIRGRYAHVKSVGGTPLADGIHFGLNSLENRPEAHKVLFVVTDGLPTCGVDVIPWLLKRAKANGVHVIGVGVGLGSIFVQSVFPDHVWSKTLADIPAQILVKLNQMLEKRLLAKGVHVRKLAYRLPTQPQKPKKPKAKAKGP